MVKALIQPKVSVIVPIYKAERTIERCAESLLEQTLKELEFIFINDCTPDKSMILLRKTIEKYPKRKKQVRIIDLKKNQGIANVRRIGIKHAKGDYIIHCDSDDYIEENAYEEMYNFAQKGNYDIVITNNYIHSKKSISLYIGVNDTEKTQLIQDYLLANKSAHLWSILVNREITHNDIIMYPKGQMLEDLCLIIQYVYISRKIGYLNQSYYHYQRNNNSLSYVSKNLEQVIKQCQESEMNHNIIKEFMLKVNYYSRIKHELVFSMYLMKNNLLPFLKDYMSCNIWITSYHSINKKIFFNPYISLLSKLKVLSILFHIYPYLKGYIKKPSFICTISLINIINLLFT